MAAYLVVLVVSLVLFPGNGLMWGDFPAWFLTAFVVLDANSRSPMWFGLLATVIAFLARTPMLGSNLSWDISDTVSIAFALILATLLGQLIRGAFAAGRASEDAAEARRLVERLELRHAVHDSGSARLAQLMLLTRAPRGSTSSTPRRRCRVWTARWSARPCAWFARRPPTSASTGPRAGASSRPRSLGTDTMTLSWLSDHDGRNSEPGGGLGLAGMAERAKRLGGSVQAVLEDGCFRLRVTLPRPADA